MRYYTKNECEEWLRGLERAKPEETPGVRKAHVHYPPSRSRLFYLVHWISSNLMYRSPALLWITEWGIWGSSENWHLYYRLRQSYGDLRLLHEAPGHLFLGHESEDLASFLEVAMLNGWGGYFLTQANYVNAFFSHDEYIDFFASPNGNLEEIRREFGTTEH
jgi:hypothetical protein